MKFLGFPCFLASLPSFVTSGGGNRFSFLACGWPRHDFRYISMKSYVMSTHAGQSLKHFFTVHTGNILSFAVSVSYVLKLVPSMFKLFFTSIMENSQASFWSALTCGYVGLS